MNHLQMLKDGFKFISESDCFCKPSSRLSYLGDYILNFTTYDDEMSELFASKALEVCAAINSGTTFAYIEDPEQYRWYLLMCNMPFFADKLEWGTSIRGAWWDHRIEFMCCGLWNGEDQVTEPLKFTREQWQEFIAALLAFAKGQE